MKINGKKVEIKNYKETLRDVANNAIPGYLKVAVYLDPESMTLETAVVSSSSVGVSPAPGVLVGMYEHRVSSTTLSDDIYWTTITFPDMFLEENV